MRVSTAVKVAAFRVLPFVALVAAAAAIDATRSERPTHHAVNLDDACRANVIIKSHGVSGVVIATDAGASWILTARHMWRHADHLREKFTVDYPQQDGSYGTYRGPWEAIAEDKEADIALLKIPFGPLPFVCPVRDQSCDGKLYIACGYDLKLQPLPAMPVRSKSTFLHSSHGRLFFTGGRQPGICGGSLLDSETADLCGLINAALVPFLESPGATDKLETLGACPHATIRQFLYRSGYSHLLR